MGYKERRRYAKRQSHENLLKATKKNTKAKNKKLLAMREKRSKFVK